MLRNFYKVVLKKPLTYLLLFGILMRILILISYNGVTIFPDSKTYVELSEYLYNLNFHNYSGRRTPGFPLLIAIFKGNLYLTIIFQQIIGLFSIFLIYDFTQNRTNNKETAFWVTFITSSFLHFIFYEFAILTETLSLFLTILIFWMIQKHNLLNGKSHIKYYVAISITMGFLYLTRPMFIYLPIIFTVIFFIKNYYNDLKMNLLKVIIVISIPFLCFHSWCSINKNNIGYYASSYFLGINLAQTTTTFFDKAPEKDKLIRDIVVKHRDSIKQVDPSDISMSVWHAFPELSQKTKLNNPDLCNELGVISKSLIKKHPLLYAKQVFISWKDFWGTQSTFLLNKERFKYEAPKYITYGIWKFIQQYVLILINILFVIFSIKKIHTFIKSKFKNFDMELLIVIFVIGGSVAQALVIYGNNSRFCFPYLPLIVYFVTINLIPYKSIIYNKCKRYFS